MHDIKTFGLEIKFKAVFIVLVLDLLSTWFD